MADFDFLETELGISEKDIENPSNVYENFILKIANQITDDLRKETSNKARNSGALTQSIAYVPSGRLSFEIQAEDYYKFIDEGVNPVGQNKFQTPYSFKFLSVTKNHAVALKQSYGYTLSHAYASGYVTKNKYGIKPRNITDSVINDNYLERIASDLAEVTGLMFEVTFTKNTDTWH